MGTKHDCKKSQDDCHVCEMPPRLTQWKVRLINGKPYTLRGVRTVWRGVLGNLLRKLGKAPGSYPT